MIAFTEALNVAALDGRTPRPVILTGGRNVGKTVLLGEAALVHEAGLVITVDELQFAGRSELADFAATLQQHVPDGWPLVVVLAGLPSIRDTRRGVTYLERGEWHVLGLPDSVATRAALAEPATGSGRPMSAAACDRLADASGAYPYAIQVMGHHAWRASNASGTIEDSHAANAVVAAEEDLAAGLYESRWQDASPKEREYLFELAQLAADHHDVTALEVASSLGKTTNAVSYLRDRLTQKGTIFAESGALRLAVHGMANWILRSNQSDPDSQPRLRRGSKSGSRLVDPESESDD